MTFYLFAGLVFWALYGFRFLSRELTTLSVLIAVPLFWGIATLRYHTGYDWRVYEAYFNGIDLNDLFSQLDGVVAMEPLYYMVNRAVRYFTDDFQILIAVVTTINVICILKYVRRSRCPPQFGLAFYYCWIYLPLQMGTMRQSLALSFMMLAMIAWGVRNYWKAAFCILLSIGFQVSALLYVSVFLGRLTRFVLKNKRVFFAMVLAIYSIGFGGGELFLDVFHRLNIPFVSEKIGIYQEFTLSKRSISGCGYLILNCVLLFYAVKYVPIKNRFDNMLFGCIILLIVFLGVFFDFALLWNRVQYLAVLPQAILLYRLILCLSTRGRWVAYPAVVLLSVSMLAYQLVGINGLPFTPYYSYLEYLATDDEGTGRDRAIEYLDYFDSVAR